ncbi:hypothetical protein BDR07DRAFT_1287704, partial [Suillus spraguei]
FFNRTDVKKAIHAPVDTEWLDCANTSVFPNEDGSLPSVFTMLPNVQRTVIVHGLANLRSSLSHVSIDKNNL